MRYVLDTTAFSAAMRRDKGLFGFLGDHHPGDIVTVPPVVAEIEFGIERVDHSHKKYLSLKAEKDRLLSVIMVLPWTPEASSHFGAIKADLASRGRLIDDFDIAIAAIAMAHECDIITANLAHFRRIAHLNSRSWNAKHGGASGSV